MKLQYIDEYTGKKYTKKIRRYFHGVTCWEKGLSLWWCPSLKKWTNIDDYADENGRVSIGFSNHSPPLSIRAFRKALKRWGKYLPEGIAFLLCNRYGYHVLGKTTREKNNGKTS